MPRDLFGDVTRPSISIGNRKWYTVPVSLFSHSFALGVLIVLPVLAPQVMPSVFADDDPDWIRIDLPDPPPPPRPKPIKIEENLPDSKVAPTDAPEGIRPETRQPEIDPGFEGTGTVPGDAFNFDSQVGGAPPPPPEPPKPVRVGGTVRPPLRVHHVDPVYPPIALQAGVQGIVIVEATIAEDGQVTNARILRSIPLLDQAALNAVQQWRYTPTTLNGVPVPVIMTVTVMFGLNR